MGMPRDKTRPANPQSGTHREKTRPARQNSAVLAFFRSAGRKISRFLRRHSKQGEFSRADHHTLATQRTPTVQNSPGTQRVRPQPVQNSPSTAKNTQISPFEASREKIIPVETETSDAGRILSRRPPHTSHAGHTHWDKTLPASRKTHISAHSRRAGRKLSRSRCKQPTQGEFYPAVVAVLPLHNERGPAKASPVSSHGNLPKAKASPVSCSMHPPHRCPMRTPPTKSHAIPSPPKRTTTQNVGIPMIEFQSWKYSSAICMRNCRATTKTAYKTGPVVVHRPRLVSISA